MKQAPIGRLFHFQPLFRIMFAHQNGSGNGNPQ